MIINFHGIIIKTLGQRSTSSYIFSLILTLILKYRPSVKPHCKHSLRSQQSLACTFSSYILILIILSFYFCKLGILLQCEKYIMLLLNRQRKMARTFYRFWMTNIRQLKQSKSQCVMLTEAFRILKRVGFYCSHRVHFFFIFFKQFCFLNSIKNRRLKLDTISAIIRQCKMPIQRPNIFTFVQPNISLFLPAGTSVLWLLTRFILLSEENVNIYRNYSVH